MNECIIYKNFNYSPTMNIFLNEKSVKVRFLSCYAPLHITAIDYMSKSISF